MAAHRTKYLRRELSQGIPSDANGASCGSFTTTNFLNFRASRCPSRALGCYASGSNTRGSAIAGEVEQYVDRLETVSECAAARTPASVVLHTDFGGWNLLLDGVGCATAILDWDQLCVGPREHDVWIAFEHADPVAFLAAYGAGELDGAHLEYALLRRAVQDVTARLVAGTDRVGVETWGFARWRRLDADLNRAAPFIRR